MNSKLKEEWLREEQEIFQGWDFSHLSGRWESEELPWDYTTVVNEYRNPDQKLLDMGTGGGEFLLSLKHPYENTSVTESWAPNIQLCKERLEPLGIKVSAVENISRLPFADDSFDIVVNRHAAYDADEIKRVLKPDGMFITEQVGEKNNILLSQRLIENYRPKYLNFTLKAELERFEDKRFVIRYRDEAFLQSRFYDIGAVAYYAKIIPWEFPGFSVEHCYEKLCALQKDLEQFGFVESSEHRFILAAQNMK